MNELLEERLRPYFEPLAKKVQSAAISIAWCRGDDTRTSLLTNSAGLLPHHITTDSQFLVYSITKSFTALTILRFAATGKLRLDAPISQWLPDVPHAERITIRQCLQHTSGLADYGSLPEYHAAVRQGRPPWTFEEFLVRVNAEQLLFEPGCGWAYSNIGYMILLRLIEVISGVTYADSVDREICHPLGLIRTSVIAGRSELRDLTIGYSVLVSSDGSPVDVRARYDPNWVATGVIASTASEIACFYHSLFKGTILTADRLREMCAVVQARPSHPRFVTLCYGLGLIADPDSPYGPIYGHGGEGPGYSASAIHFGETGPQALTVTLLSNTENHAALESMTLAAGEALMKQRDAFHN
ncbi:MAG: beta-lactamase family protein [Nitrospira sp.]